MPGLDGLFNDAQITRRQALKYGVAAGLVTVLARVPTAARAATSDPDAAFRRASYGGLVGQTFAVGGATLVLSAVDDVAAHPGADDAFRLEFTGEPGAVGEGTAEVSHATLGTFDLYVGPVDVLRDGAQTYEAVIDRTIPLPGAVAVAPAPAPASAPAPAASAPAAVAAAAKPATAAKKPAAVTQHPAKKKKHPAKKKKKPHHRVVKKLKHALSKRKSKRKR